LIYYLQNNINTDIYNNNILKKLNQMGCGCKKKKPVVTTQSSNQSTTQSSNQSTTQSSNQSNNSGN
jgi:hypothetical protein